jgi:hypothetical protein
MKERWWESCPQSASDSSTSLLIQKDCAAR